MENSSSIELPLAIAELTPETDQKKLGPGPFRLVKAPKNVGGGLTWLGVPEKCDRCREFYPMSWITISEDGKRFLCAECEFQEDKLALSELTHECDICHNIVLMNEMTIEYNNLICRRCRQPTNDSGKYDHFFQD